jgi:hypothetical protein
MPKYILPVGTSEAEVRLASLDAFTRGYITAAFWTECNEDRTEEGLDDAELSDLADEAWAKATEDCREFQESFAELLSTAYASEDAGYSDESAGIDFWLTRNGHGTGFWDRGLGEVGDRLADMARPYAQASLYRGDDGKVYLS